ncbi:unnamed protein product, partial [Prorocentrum cordatum]
VAREVAAQELSRLAVEQPFTPCTRVVSDVLGETDQPDKLAMPGNQSLKKRVWAARASEKGKKLKQGEDIEEPDYSSVSTVCIPKALMKYDDDPFLLYDAGQPAGEDRFLIFGTGASVQTLATCSRWFADGSFRISPEPFVQVYTIHGVVAGYALPLLYALLPNKKTTTYVQLFNAVRLLVSKVPGVKGVAGAVERISLDVEFAAYKGVCQVFPGVAADGCYFHLQQAIMRRIQDSGLTQKYFEDQAFRIRARCLGTLSFLPPGSIPGAFELLRGEFPPGEHHLLSYFEHTWVGELDRRKVSVTAKGPPKRAAPLFPLEFWSTHERALKGDELTNNIAER